VSSPFLCLVFCVSCLVWQSHLPGCFEVNIPLGGIIEMAWVFIPTGDASQARRVLQCSAVQCSAVQCILVID